MGSMTRSYSKKKLPCGGKPFLSLLIILSLASMSNSDLLAFPSLVAVGGLVNLTCTNTTTACPHGRVWLQSQETENIPGIVEQARTADEIRVVMRATEPKQLYYYCICGNGSDEGRHVIGMKYIQVGYPPAPATNFTCYAPAWKEIICRWDSPPSRVLETRWNVTFTVYVSRERIIASSITELLENKTCNMIGDRPACRVSPDKILKYKTYVFTVVAINEFGKSETIFEVTNEEAIVKPLPVSNLSLANLSSSSVMLSWYANGNGHTGMEYIIQNMALDYKVEFSTQQGQATRPQRKVKTFTSANIAMILANLQPFTVYNAAVTSRLHDPNIPGRRLHVSEGIWSEPVSVTFTTGEAAPAVAPGVHNGCGFSYVDTMDCSKNDHGLTLYWQGIPEMSGYGNGNITSYVIYVHNEERVIETKGSEREASLCTPEVDGYTYKLLGATAAGLGKKESAIQVTSYLNASALWIRPCDITAKKINETSVDITWELRPHSLSSGRKRKASSNSSERAGSSRAKQHRYVVFWCKNEGRSYCTGDIHWSSVIEPRSAWPNNQTTGHFLLNLRGHVDDFRVGVSRYAASNVCGGISWAECMYADDGAKSRVVPPEVSLADDGQYLVKAKRVQCTHGSVKTLMPVARVLHWCDHSALSVTGCNGGRAAPLCCRESTMQSRVIDWCDYEGIIQGNRSGVALWVQHIYSNGDYANSSIIFFDQHMRHNPHAAIEGTWTSAMVGGTIIGALSFVCVSATLIVLLRSYLRSNMNIKNIKKVPAVTGEMLRDEQDDIYDSGEGLYMPQAVKLKENKAVDHRMSLVNHSRDRLIGGLGLNGKEVQGNEDSISFGMCSDDHGVIAETFSSYQTWTGSCEYGMALPVHCSSRDLSSDRYIRPLTDDNAGKAAAATAKMHVLNWLPIPALYKSDCQPEATVTAASIASEYQSRISCLSESCGGHINCPTPDKHVAKARAAAGCGEQGVLASEGLTSLGISCPALASEECAGGPSPSQTGASSQATASTSCSSLDYWMAAPGGSESLAARGSQSCRQSAVSCDSSPGGLKCEPGGDGDYVRAHVSGVTCARRAGQRSKKTKAKAKQNLDYIESPSNQLP